MAVEKTRIKERFKILFPKINLSATRLDAIAAKLSQIPEDDADDEAVDQTITEYDESAVVSFEEIAKHDDKVRSLETRLKKGTPKEEPNKPKTKEDPADPDLDEEADMTPAMKLMFKQMKVMSEQITSMQAEKTKASIADKFKADERLKGVPEFMFKGRIPASDDDYETAVEELIGDFKPWAEKVKLEAFNGEDTPTESKGGGSKANTVKQASDKEVEELIENLRI